PTPELPLELHRAADRLAAGRALSQGPATGGPARRAAVRRGEPFANRRPLRVDSSACWRRQHRPPMTASKDTLYAHNKSPLRKDAILIRPLPTSPGGMPADPTAEVVETGEGLP